MLETREVVNNEVVNKKGPRIFAALADENLLAGYG